MLEILTKLRKNAPEAFKLYADQFEQDYNYHLGKLMSAPPDSVLRQQGIVAIMNSHLALLKLSL